MIMISFLKKKYYGRKIPPKNEQVNQIKGF